MAIPLRGLTMPLANDDGYTNMGDWIEIAAKDTGR